MADSLAKLQARIDSLGTEMEAMLTDLEESGWADSPGDRELITWDPDESIPRWASLPDGFVARYQKWYSACRTLVQRSDRERLPEVEGLYDPRAVGKGAGSSAMGIRHRLVPLMTKEGQYALMDGIRMQYAILAAVPDAMAARMLDVELTIFAKLGDDEIVAARHLHKNGYFRAAGAVAGVVLEGHLKMVLDKHSPPVKRSASAMLGKLNELCKDSGVYDQPTWHKIQGLIGLRNRCDHKLEDEPTKDEVKELIDGVERVTHQVTPGYT